MRLAILAAIVVVFLALFGCASPPAGQGQAPPVQIQQGQQANQAPSAPPAEVANAGAGGQGSASSEWKAPDGSITLQVPKGWAASERLTDNCTVSWEVRDAAGTSSAFMNNQVIVFKSENARQMYKAYGMAGIGNAPVGGYLGAEQALSQIIAPLSGSSNVKVLSRDAALSAQFSQAACIPGLAACDARVFEAAFNYKGVLMRGYYLVQAYDFGDGTTWWINLWGYEAQASDWEKSAGTLERIFTSVKATDKWAARCGASSGGAEGVINEVIRSRQASSEKSAEEWGKYIRGE